MLLAFLYPTRISGKKKPRPCEALAKHSPTRWCGRHGFLANATTLRAAMIKPDSKEPGEREIRVWLQGWPTGFRRVCEPGSGDLVDPRTRTGATLREGCEGLRIDRSIVLRELLGQRRRPV